VVRNLSAVKAVLVGDLPAHMWGILRHRLWA
jgi:hypothetical protein